MDIRQMRPQMIEDMGIDLEDDEQMHIFEGLRKNNERLKEKLSQNDKYRQVIEDELTNVKETLTNENNMLKNKLNEV